MKKKITITELSIFRTVEFLCGNLKKKMIKYMNHIFNNKTLYAFFNKKKIV